MHVPNRIQPKMAQKGIHDLGINMQSEGHTCSSVRNICKTLKTKYITLYRFDHPDAGNMEFGRGFEENPGNGQSFRFWGFQTQTWRAKLRYSLPHEPHPCP